MYPDYTNRDVAIETDEPATGNCSQGSESFQNVESRKAGFTATTIISVGLEGTNFLQVVSTYKTQKAATGAICC